MAAVTVHFNTEQVVAALDQLGRAGQTGLRRARRRTATSVRSVMASATAKDIGLRVGTVRDEIKIRHDDDAHTSTISISGSRIPLIEFSARGPEPSRGRGRGVSYRIGQEGRKRLAQTFIATMKSGHRGVFKRQTKARLPILELRGPSLPSVFAKYLPLGVQRAEDQLGKNLEHELAFALSHN